MPMSLWYRLHLFFQKMELPYCNGFICGKSTLSGTRRVSVPPAPGSRPVPRRRRRWLCRARPGAPFYQK